MHVVEAIKPTIRTVYLHDTYIYLHYEHQKSNTYFFKTIPLGVCIWYVFASILFVYCKYIVRIL